MTYNTINDAQTIAGSGEGTLLANRYRVVRQLGQGGMGSVWLAEDTQLDNKPFAIKMLPSILVSNKRAYRQLKDEALVAMKLTHPNIVTLRAFEENSGNPFLVMDYIDGQTLDDYLAEHTGTTGVSPVATGLPEADVLRILRPIAAALDYAHSEGVVHRDVKPANVMIRKDGHPYILDFGVAREIQETMTCVTGKLSSGTLLYMSPEQLHGASPKPAQDIYSFAAMVYECLKGKPPFVRGQIEYQIDNDRPEPLPGGPRFCAAAVMVGLAKKPEDRPASCTAVLDGRIVPDAPQPGRARSPSAPVGGVWKVLLVTTVLALVIGGGWWLSSRATKRTRTTRGTNTTESIGAAKITDAGEITKPAKKTTTNGKIVALNPMTKQNADPVVFVAAATNVVPVVSVQAVLSNETAAALAAARGVPAAVDALARHATHENNKDVRRSSVEGQKTRKIERVTAGHKGVQLWEGGPYWAEANIGAEKPWEYGYYFWWGDTVGCKNKNGAWVANDGSSVGFSFKKENSSTFGKDIATLWRDGWITTANVLVLEHDAARVLWGGGWRIPTSQELDDICNKCEWTWTKMNGVNGYVVRGRGDYASASIFLPAAGFGEGTWYPHSGSVGYYWSSVPSSGFACNLFFRSDYYGGKGFSSFKDRYLGFPVRPVQGVAK